MKPEQRIMAANIAQPAAMSAREPVRRWTGTEQLAGYDDLAVEEPLQILFAGEDVAVAMRTPGHDAELAAGFLLSEGVITRRDQIDSIANCLDEAGAPAPNVINVLPSDRNLLEPGRWGRNFISSSSCGLCGKTSIAHITARTTPLHSNASVRLDTLYSLVDKLHAAQAIFTRTGGIHAAGLFTTEGDLLVLREDVGRHNAVDKVVGHALLNDMLPLNNHILLVSSRASFEIVQKALVAGIGIMAVISAPSSLAVEMARDANMTLVAFLRGERLNVYSGHKRVRK